MVRNSIADAQLTHSDIHTKTLQDLSYSTRFQLRNAGKYKL